MNRNTLLALSFSFALAMTSLISCGETEEPDNGNNSGNDDSDVMVINGTQIKEGMTAVGLIYDSSTKKGIPNVPVTDGYTYTKTDANGVYQMSMSRYCRNVYYSTPKEYKIALNSTTHLPQFYSTSKLSTQKVNRNDFALEPLDAPEDNWTLLVVSDPQCKTTTQAARYVNETIPDIKKQVAAIKSTEYPHVYSVTVGDLIFDSDDIYPLMKDAMSNVKVGEWYVPMFSTVGNHDHNATKASDYAAVETYVENFGPTDYSFDRGNAHVVVMDNVLCTTPVTNASPNGATWSYNAGLTNQQFKWLQEDIACVDKKEEKTIIFCTHVPFWDGVSTGGNLWNYNAYYSETLTLLQGFKEAHIMIGHTHAAQNCVHNDYKTKNGNPIYEHIHGAACGGFWSCNSNVNGAPNGYSVYSVSKDGVQNWLYKSTGKQNGYQIRVYDGNQNWGKSTNSLDYCWYNTGIGMTESIFAGGNAVLKNTVVAEIWDDDDQYWTVEFWQNGAKVGNFTKLTNCGCVNVPVCAYFYNTLGKATTSWCITWTDHYWYFKPESGDASAVLDAGNWEVKAVQTIPNSNVKNEFSCTSVTRDFTEY